MGDEQKGRNPALRGEPLRRAIPETIARFVDLSSHEVFIFGSEARSDRTDRSDIDVGILSPHPIPGPVMQRIQEDLERLRTLRAFDVVDFARVQSCGPPECRKTLENQL
jgi:predicted nucleotidyltransferase